MLTITQEFLGTHTKLSTLEVDMSPLIQQV
jgi:hypothetical protein